MPPFSYNLAHATQPASYTCQPRRRRAHCTVSKRLNINHFHCPVQVPGPYSGVGRPPPPHLAFGRPLGWPQHLPGPGPPGMMGPPPPHAAPEAHHQQWRPRGQGESACSCWHLHIHVASRAACLVLLQLLAGTATLLLSSVCIIPAGKWHLPATWQNAPACCCCDNMFIPLRQPEQPGGAADPPRASQAELACPVRAACLASCGQVQPV